MSKKYYVVWKGAKPGIYGSWPEAKSQTEGRADAQFMGFPSKAEAESAYQSTYTKALMRRSMSKSTTPANSGYSKSGNSASDTYKSVSNIDVQIYCDGACSPNPGKSGTGLAVYEKNHHELKLMALWYGLYDANGTNNTAELNGMLKSFELAKKYTSTGAKVQILSDSKYSIDCITQWAKGWQRKGWTRGKGEAIKNLELVKACFTLYEELKAQLIITHVKGHANIEGNELSDRMAVLARKQSTSEFVQFTETLDIPTILAMSDDS